MKTKNLLGFILDSVDISLVVLSMFIDLIVVC